MSTLEETTMHHRRHLKEWRLIVYIEWQQKHSGKHFFQNKISIFGFLCHSTCESLSIHVSITTCMTDIDEAKWFQYFSTSQNSISTFNEKKINFLGFRAVALNYYCKTDIDETRMNSTLRHMSKYKSKFNFDLFWKENLTFCFHSVVLVKNFPFMYQLQLQV